MPDAGHARRVGAQGPAHARYQSRHYSLRRTLCPPPGSPPTSRKSPHLQEVPPPPGSPPTSRRCPKPQRRSPRPWHGARSPHLDTHPCAEPGTFHPPSTHSQPSAKPPLTLDQLPLLENCSPSASALQYSPVRHYVDEEPLESTTRPTQPAPSRRGRYCLPTNRNPEPPGMGAERHRLNTGLHASRGSLRPCLCARRRRGAGSGGHRLQPAHPGLPQHAPGRLPRGPQPADPRPGDFGSARLPWRHIRMPCPMFTTGWPPSMPRSEATPKP